MAAQVKAPPLRESPGVTALAPESMAASRPYVASDKIQQAIGFPGTLDEDFAVVRDKAIAHMGSLLQRYRSLKVYLDACVHCGACSDKCHYFIGTGDPKNMPVARQDLMRSVYRRYFTWPGRLVPGLVGARDLTREVLDEWYTYYHQCSECRRCSVFCPYGIDTAEITMAGREILDAVGYGQKYSNEIIGKVHRIGNNLGLPGPALADTLTGLEEDVKEDTGADVRFPLDVKGAEVLLVTPSADFFAEPHVESLIGYAKVFHAAGVTWTMSSHASEAGNFGLFIGNYEQLRRIALRIREAALELGVKRIVVGECGHAWRVAYSFWNTLAGIGAGANDPFAVQLQRQLDGRYRQPMHICEFTWDLIQRGALSLDAQANDHRVVTFHDSCNVARASRMGDLPGGQFDIPRAIIRASANRFVEMDPETTHERTFCCGGGGGLLTDELLDLRVKGALPRMEALRAVADRHGVNFMATICAICKAQFSKVLPYYGFKMGMVGGVHQLVSTAIQLGPQAVNQPNPMETCDVGQSRTAHHGADLPALSRRRTEVEEPAPEDLRRRPLAQVPDLCAVDAAVPGQLPVGRGHPRLPEHRARHREAAGRAAVAGVRVAPADPGQPVPVGDGPGLPGAVRDRVQPQRGRGPRRHQLGRALPGRVGDPNGLGFVKPQVATGQARWPSSAAGRPACRARTSWRSRATT